jgi:hypothetical protein
LADRHDETGLNRAGARQSWLVGLGLGVPAGFLLLAFPIAGLAIFAAAGAVVIIKGRGIAGIGGLLIGIGATWVALFARIKLTCTWDPATGSGCLAPTIDGYLAISVAILAVGFGTSWFARHRTRRA